MDNPQHLNHFRLISLVGCMYKVLAKVLVNRLRLVIGSIVVSHVQSAFIKGRHILAGVFIPNEMVDEARKLHKEMMLFKVDFNKAFYFMDQHYLDDVMKNMNFLVLWRKWISECVGSATTSVLVNGCPTDEFSLERVLRKGNPLSPFPFLLAAEGLNVLVHSLVDNDLFSGYSVGSTTLVHISDLQFVDDTLIIGEKS